MEESKIKIGVIRKEIFYQRLYLEKELGDFLYDQIMSVLELLGEEAKDNGITDIRIGIYLDTNNDGGRYFYTSDKVADVIHKYFAHKFHKEIEKYGKKQQAKGSELLFQLNAGNITVKDFGDKLNR